MTADESMARVLHLFSADVDRLRSRPLVPVCAVRRSFAAHIRDDSVAASRACRFFGRLLHVGSLVDERRAEPIRIGSELVRLDMDGLYALPVRVVNRSLVYLFAAAMDGRMGNVVAAPRGLE